MSRKKKVLVICHLCFTFTFLCWLLLQPYVKEVMSQKSILSLFEMVMQRETHFQNLPQADQELLLSEHMKVMHKERPSFIGQIGRLFFITTHPFALAWLFFSLAIALLLLFEIEGAVFAAWLLPIIVVGYAYFLYDAPRITQSSLFPTEAYVSTHYVPEDQTLKPRERLLLGWHRYLITEWGHETPSQEKQEFAKQVDKGLFAFNIERIKWVISGKEDEVVRAGFSTPPSLLQLAAYFLWNLFFAWFVNREKNQRSTEAQSAKSCST